MNVRVYDPNRRQHYEFHREGESLLVDIWVAPGGDAPAHFHPSQEERWKVLEGRIRFKVDGRKTIPEPGVEIIVPAGVKHSFKNIGDSEARARAEVRPPLELQRFLEDGAALARAGCYTRRGVIKSPKGAVQMARFLERYRDDTTICWPPRIVQRVLLAPLRRVSSKPQ
jgi:quercetin dioxygenase-like cupin family protein